MIRKPTTPTQRTSPFAGLGISGSLSGQLGSAIDAAHNAALAKPTKGTAPARRHVDMPGKGHTDRLARRP
jgi:hypothetical protein